MKRCAFVVLSLLFVASAVSAALPRVAVMALENRTAYRGIRNDLEGGTADMLVTALAKTGRFRVIERSALDKVLAEQKLGAAGLVTPQTAARIGKLLGAEYMVVGSVNEYGQKTSGVGAFGVGVKTHTAAVGLDIRVIETTGGAVVAAATGYCKKSARAVAIDNTDILPTELKVGSPRFNTSLIGRATRGAVDEAAGKVAAALGGSWSGSVVRVADDGDIVVTGGESAGIAVGDVFRIVRRGEELIDPETGESLGSEDSAVGEVEVTAVRPKYAHAKLLSGGPVRAKDRVEKK